METLISLHLPKTAGASFGRALAKHFGDAFVRDYAGHSMGKPVYERHREALIASMKIAEEGLAGIKCVHGHFLPVKYLLLSSKQKFTFVTWIRDPVERILSHYYYWQRSYDPEKSAPRHREVVEEGWSVERFCLGPEFRNWYCQYLWGFPFEMFDFIGITEFYEEDLTYFSRTYLGAPLDMYRLKVGERRGKQYEIDPDFRRAIARHHDQDVQLYHRALQKRLAREGF
jgi:hypothetical protein